jgi:hypothetical protein
VPGPPSGGTSQKLSVSEQVQAKSWPRTDSAAAVVGVTVVRSPASSAAARRGRDRYLGMRQTNPASLPPRQTRALHCAPGRAPTRLPTIRRLRPPDTTGLASSGSEPEGRLCSVRLRTRRSQHILTPNRPPARAPSARRLRCRTPRCLIPETLGGTGAAVPARDLSGVYGSAGMASVPPARKQPVPGTSPLASKLSGVANANVKFIVMPAVSVPV